MSGSLNEEDYDMLCQIQSTLEQTKGIYPINLERAQAKIELTEHKDFAQYQFVKTCTDIFDQQGPLSIEFKNYRALAKSSSGQIIFLNLPQYRL